MVTWEEVGLAIDEMEAALSALGLVDPRPAFEYFGERSAITFSNEPGVLGTRQYTIGVRQDGVAALEASWDETLHRLDPNASGLD